MSSERDDSGEPLDESPVKSEAEKSDSTSPIKSNGPTEHAKHRRRRGKGKKRKQRELSGNSLLSTSGASQLRSDVSGSAEITDGQVNTCSAMDPSSSKNNSESDLSRSKSHLETEPSYDSDSPWNSNEELESNEVLSFSGQIIRPNAPHAPRNSTQFIIDDHNECHLYMSFETPNPYLCEDANDGTDHVINEEPIGEDPAYIDIDYQYQSPQDFDNTAYYDREFELSYKSNRFEELLRLPREELISGLQALESRLKELSDDLVKENPSPILEKLQHDLLELQEKHCELKEANTKLTALVMQNEKTAERWAEQQTLNDNPKDCGTDASDHQVNYNEDASDHQVDYNEDASDHQCTDASDHQVDYNEDAKDNNSVPETSDDSVNDSSNNEIEADLRDNCCVTNNKSDSKADRIDCKSPREDSVEMSDLYIENNGLDTLPRKVESEDMRAATIV